jgi:mycoredoxin
MEETMSGRLTMYTTSWCGYCVRLKRGLERAGIDFDEVNIETDAEAERFVLSANDGNATVPTLRLPSGEVMTNPPLPDLLAALGAA